MLRRATLLALTFAIALFAGCAEEAITPNSVFDFKSAEQQRDFERRARAGDIAAARRLVDYWYFWRNDLHQALYWARVAASHGDKISAENAQRIKEAMKEKNENDHLTKR